MRENVQSCSEQQNTGKPGKQRWYSLEASLPRLTEIMWLADPLLHKILGVIIHVHPSSKKVGRLPAKTARPARHGSAI